MVALTDSNFCGYPEAQFAFMFFCLMPIIFLIMFAITGFFWLLALIPVVLVAYLWFFEDIPWRGRYYGYCMEPGGGLAYSGEEYACHSCKHIRDQLDCKYGCLTSAEKFEHRNDWKQRYPCSMCCRSGAFTTQDLYKGPVRWAEGERP